jgi:hypothetical protein
MLEISVLNKFYVFCICCFQSSIAFIRLIFITTWYKSPLDVKKKKIEKYCNEIIKYKVSHEGNKVVISQRYVTSIEELARQEQEFHKNRLKVKVS